VSKISEPELSVVVAFHVRLFVFAAAKEIPQSFYFGLLLWFFDHPLLATTKRLRCTHSVD
jgi:hypothetical protein